MNSKRTGGRIAAIFDVDGTMIEGSMERIFIRFLWKRGILRPADFLNLAGGALDALAAGRSPFLANKAYLRGRPAQAVRRLAHECFEAEIGPLLLPAAVARLRWHQDSGHYVILISGSLDVLLEPLAESLGVRARIGTRLETDSRTRLLTGRVVGLHPHGRAKQRCLADINSFGIFDLKRSFAYADRYADRFLLSSVGNPVAVNADPDLRRLVEKRDWLMEDFIHAERNLTEGAYGRV